jgi:type I restriction enzyme S subunit
VALSSLVIQEPDYGSGARAVPKTSVDQPRYIRITDFGDDGIEDDHEYVAPDPIENECLLAPNDLLFARSGATVGKTYLHEDISEPAIFAGYCIRFKFDPARVLPKFVYYYTKTRSYARWVAAIQRPSGQPNINKEEFKSLLLPLPPLSNQLRFVARMDAAQLARQRKTSEAGALEDGLEGYLITKLGLSATMGSAPKAFAVRRSSIRHGRIDPPAYQPLGIEGSTSTPRLTDLAKIADLDLHSQPKPTDDAVKVPYVGLPECDLRDVREVIMRPYREVKGRSIVCPGDILFARIEPSVFNKKYVLVDHMMGHEYAYTSTEFYVVTPRPEFVVTDYLYAMFFCSFVFNQTKGKTTGSSGRRRLDPELFRTLQIPLPKKEEQVTISQEARRRWKLARELREQADQDWQSAKRRFENELFGSTDS